MHDERIQGHHYRNIENNVIRSDDPQAVEKLQAKLDKLTEQHTRMKEINGFKWAPSVGAWQRQLNDNAIYAASRLDFLRPESGESPTALQPKTPAKSTPERG